MGMNPPLARELAHEPGKQRPGTNYTNEFTQIEWVKSLTAI